MKNDAFLHYNVGDWAKYGLAVPNYGNDTHSQNDTIRQLVSMVGKNLQAIMWHADSRLDTPPSINTIIRIHRLCLRARLILSSRAVPAGTPNLESSHAVPAPEVFLVFPTPYFTVRNQWLKQYAGLIMTALTDAMQMQENARPIEISEQTAKQIGQYVQRVYRMLANELLQIPLATVLDPAFTISDAQLAAYNPGLWYTSTEMMATVPAMEDWPTEDDLEVLSNGLPVTSLPVLGRYPTTPSTVSTGAPVAGASTGSFLGSPTP